MSLEEARCRALMTGLPPPCCLGGLGDVSNSKECYRSARGLEKTVTPWNSPCGDLERAMREGGRRGDGSFPSNQGMV